MSGCACGENWRVESCDLRTGIIQTTLHPVAMDWQMPLTDWGQGTLTLPVRDVLVRDVWPHLTSIFISRIAGEDASPDDPVVEFGGMVETISATEDGTLKVGMVSIESYIRRRMIRTDFDFSDGEQQTIIAQTLVTLAASGTGGIPLLSTAAPSAQERQITYNSWDRKVIGDAVTELSQMDEGVEWGVRYERTGDHYTVIIDFADSIGEDRGVILQSDRDGDTYGLDVDAANHATFVDAIGEGEEEDQMIATAVDTGGPYPVFDAAPAYKDTWDEDVLQAQADGYLLTNREPNAVPNMTLRGLDPPPTDVRLGDTVGVHIDYGAATYHGDARITNVAWSVAVDEPETRSFDFQPITRASDSVLNQVPGNPCEGC